MNRPRRLAGALLATVLLPPSLAPAELPHPASGAVAPTSAPPWSATHAWFAEPLPGGTWALAHLPPREMSGPSDGVVHGAKPGTVRRAAQIPAAPAALAATGSTVYAVVETRTQAGIVAARNVYSTSAAASGLGDLWVYEPVGRLRAEPVLPAGGSLLGAACDQIGPVAVIRWSAPEEPRTHVQALALRSGEWRQVPMPDSLVGALAEHPAAVVSRRSGVSIVVGGSADELTEYSLTLTDPAPPAVDWDSDDGDAPAPPPAPRASWTSRLWQAPGAARALDAGAARIFECGGVLTMAVMSGGRMDLSRFTSGVAREFMSIDGAGPAPVVVALDGAGVIVCVRSTPARAPIPAAPGTPAEVLEFSAYSGRTIYEGPRRAGGLLRPGDLAILAGVMVSAMGAALVIVLRRDPADGVVNLPDGFALAAPVRRIAATLVDVAIAIVIAARVWGVAPGVVLSATGFVSGESWWIIASALVCGAVVGTVLEWTFGRTIGKLLAGIEVISVAPGPPGPRQPRLFQAAIRNGVKWLLPPVVVLGLLDSAARHHGDIAARTATVNRFDTEQPD